jgi:hypothetical protein
MRGLPSCLTPRHTRDCPPSTFSSSLCITFWFSSPPRHSCFTGSLPCPPWIPPPRCLVHSQPIERSQHVAGSTHDYLHEQLSLAREALVEMEKKIINLRQEYESKESEMEAIVQELEVKLLDSQAALSRCQQQQARCRRILPL